MEFRVDLTEPSPGYDDGTLRTLKLYSAGVGGRRRVQDPDLLEY